MTHRTGHNFLERKRRDAQLNPLIRHGTVEWLKEFYRLQPETHRLVFGDVEPTQIVENMHLRSESAQWGIDYKDGDCKIAITVLANFGMDTYYLNVTRDKPVGYQSHEIEFDFGNGGAATFCYDQHHNSRIIDFDVRDALKLDIAALERVHAAQFRFEELGLLSALVRAYDMSLEFLLDETTAVEVRSEVIRMYDYRHDIGRVHCASGPAQFSTPPETFSPGYLWTENEIQFFYKDKNINARTWKWIKDNHIEVDMTNPLLFFKQPDVMAFQIDVLGRL